MSRVVHRGDDIPPVSAYAHWNEDAELMWYAENRYDMEHADEIVTEEDDDFSTDDMYCPHGEYADREGGFDCEQCEIAGR
jgi:hypothetical protein